MLPFGVTIPATVPQRSEIPEGLTNYPVYCNLLKMRNCIIIIIIIIIIIALENVIIKHVKNYHHIELMVVDLLVVYHLSV